MNVDNWRAELEKNLPDVEKYLISVLQEEAKITVLSTENVDKNDLDKYLNKNDIFVFAKDDIYQNSIILAMDKGWLGLLSGIMMGVEEKANNEITRDLLKKFTTELSVILKKKMRRDGLRLAPGEIEVLTLKQLEKKFEHGEFFYAKMQVGGLTEEDIRADLLLGNPAVRLNQTEADSGRESEESNKKAAESTSESVEEHTSGEDNKKATTGKEKSGENSDEKSRSDEKDKEDSGSDSINSKTEASASDKLFTKLNTESVEDDKENKPRMNDNEVISGRSVDFEDFDLSEKDGNGHPRSMALLKDVEMDVSVQLGQIEMPLGKVLQLAKGSIIELDKLAGEPVDILVNGSKIANGEVVVIDEHFGVRISNLITTRERIARLK